MSDEKLLCLATFRQVSAFEKGTTLEQFVKFQKGEAQKKGVEFKEKQFLKQFADMDTNSDGEISKEERKNYWASKKKK